MVRRERCRTGALAATMLLAAGCGSPNHDNSTPRERERAEALAQAQSVLRAPEILVVAAAARQRAAPAKSCVLTVAQGRGEGAGKCTILKRPVHPRAFTVVAPGDVIEIAVPGAKIIKRPGCTDPRECGGWVVVRRAGCRRGKVASFPLSRARTRWRVGLAPGAYELTISVDFETPEALTGDATAIAGLLVAEGATLRVASGTRITRTCGAG